MHVFTCPPISLYCFVTSAPVYPRSTFCIAPLNLDRVSLAFGHLPLLSDADLRIEPGERICLIGRNGAGKSEPAQGRIRRDPAGCGADLARSRAAGRASRAGRSARGRPLGVRRGRLRARRARRARRQLSPCRCAQLAENSAAPGSDAALTRLGELQHQLEERDGWRLEQKVGDGAVPSGSPCRTGRCASCQADGGAARCLGRRSSRSRTCCSSTSPRTTSTSMPSGGSRSICATTPARSSSSPTTARSCRRWRRGSSSSIAARSLRGRDLCELSREEEPSRSRTRRASSHRLDKKLAKEEAWLRQGVKARRTRNEGRVKT